MKPSSIWLLAVSIMLISCTSSVSDKSITQLDTPTEAELASYDSTRLCQMYYRSDKQNSSIRNELENRELLGSTEWELINRSSIELGMSELALTCSWGVANGGQSVSQSTSGHRKMLRFIRPSESAQFNSFRYTVDIENDKVIGWRSQGSRMPFRKD